MCIWYDTVITNFNMIIGNVSHIMKALVLQ